MTERDGSTEREVGPVESAVRANLARWGQRVAETTFAAQAIDLAARLDGEDVRPAAAAELHAQLRATVVELIKLAPEDADDDAVDELQRKRRERRGA